MDNLKLNNTLKSTVYASLFIQIITGIIGIYVSFLPVVSEVSIIKKMLQLELFVQFIEGIFYVWFASIFSFVKNITPTRYYDWAITTPTMLFTVCLYLDYLGERDKSKENLAPLLESTNTDNGEKRPSVKDTTLVEYFKQNLGVFLPIFFLNLMMLIFGYLGEIGELDNTTAVLCGFLPFMTYFVIIYEKFAKYSSFYGKVIYWIFFKIWALYGLAALGSYYWKNIAYNILDLLAKNFFGIILAYTLYTSLA
jgi:hypothetical protein